MRLITLNAWGGRALSPLMGFFKRRAGQTDIFCLQEVLDSEQAVVDSRHPDEYLCGDLFRKISAVLPDFAGTFASFADDPHRQSLAVFVRRSLPVKAVADLEIYRPAQPKEFGSAVFSSRKIQYASLDLEGRALTVVNFHGLWNGGPKTDTPERLTQSENVKSFLDGASGRKVLCGDFNLLPDTASLGILEKGMTNLVRASGVRSTRTALYRKHDDPNDPKFADYVLVSPDIQVQRFEVLPDLVSDHAALSVEFI